MPKLNNSDILEKKYVLRDLKYKKIKLHGLIFVGERIKETQDTIKKFGTN